MVVGGPEEVTLKRKKKKRERRSPVSCEFIQARRQPGEGAKASRGCAKVSKSAEHSGRDASRAPGPDGAGAQGSDSALPAVVRASGLTRTKFDNFFTQRGHARPVKRLFLGAGT